MENSTEETKVLIVQQVSPCSDEKNGVYHQKVQLPPRPESEMPRPHPDDLPPLMSIRYWMSMLATLMCLQSFVFCIICFSSDSLKAMATSDTQMAALELTARKTLLDVGVLTIVVTVGLLLFLKESSPRPPSPDGGTAAEGVMSSLLVAYKLFQMIIAVDVAVRLLQALHITSSIIHLNFLYLITIYVFPVTAASIEITITVATFIHLQNVYRETYHQSILAIS